MGRRTMSGSYNKMVSVEPSPELVPDEYDLDKEKSGSIHIFSAFGKCFVGNEVGRLVGALEKCKITVPDENIYYVNSRGDVNASLLKIYGNVSDETTSYLLIFFLGFIEKDKISFTLGKDDVLPKDIWNFFHRDNAQHLRNTPKVLVFNGVVDYESEIQFDGAKVPHLAYEKPPEADMLIVFKRCDEYDQYDSFIDDICENIQHYSKSRDIIKLLMHINKSSKPPLLVSTLTKKLYLRPSLYRGIYFEIHQQQKLLKSLQEAVESKLEGVLSLQENNLLKATTSQSTPNVAKSANRRSCEVSGVKIDAPKGIERRRKSDTSSLKRENKRKNPNPWR